MNRLVTSLVPCLVPCLVLCSAACGDSSNNNTPDAPAGPDAPMEDAGSGSGSGDCSAARAQLLGDVDAVSTGDVAVIGSGSDGRTTLYIDASAGGLAAQGSNAWIYVSLGSGAKVAVTDTTSTSSTAWDLALKRPTIYTNDGDGGPGSGGAVLIAKDFADVTAADAGSATFATETFFDAECNPNTDPTGAALTTFSTWYDYDPTTHVLSPAAGTWLVRGGSGALYKVQIDSYYANPDGTEGSGDGGTYAIDVEAL